MIADIEFRVNKKVITPAFLDGERIHKYDIVEKVLQSRKKIAHQNAWGAWVDDWTEWHDVPVVEE